jgi:tetratricopeptide (TPR) repeat protein
MRSTIDAVPKTPQVKTTLVDRFLAPRLALALGRSGDQAAAESLAASLPQDCYRCLVARGAVASLGRYWRRAEAEFAAAERLAPSLPAAWLAAGQSRVMRGDRVGAQQAFAQAVKLGPHFADALEAWGESLMAGGDADGAGAKYAEAAKYAPRWGRLRLRWGQALAKQGKRDEARAQFQAAAGMDLSVADRAELNAQKL